MSDLLDVHRECFSCGRDIVITQENWSGFYDPRWSDHDLHGCTRKVPQVVFNKKLYQYFSYEYFCPECSKKGSLPPKRRREILKYNMLEIERRIPKEKDIRDAQIELKRMKRERGVRLKELTELKKCVGRYRDG